MKYLIPDPFCGNNVTISHVIEGVWTLSSDDCPTCALFIMRLTPVLNSLSDRFIIEMLDAMQAEAIE